MQIRLSKTSGAFEPQVDERPAVPEPLPVELVAVTDVRVRAPAELKEQIDEFYFLLGFTRPDDHGWAYRSDTTLLIFRPPRRKSWRQDYRPILVTVESIDEVASRLADAGVHYSRQRGISLGCESLHCTDPAGNFLQISEHRRLL